MSTSDLRDPVYLKRGHLHIAEDGSEWTVPDRKVKERDARITPEELEIMRESGEFSDDELWRIQVTNDPVLWCETYLANPENNIETLSLRFYQRDIMRTPTRFKVMRLGRQMGKCVHGDTYITLPNGQWKKCRDLYNEVGPNQPFDIVSYNVETDQQEIKEAVIEENGHKPSILFETRQGFAGAFTHNHKMKVYNEEGKLEDILAENLSVGMRIPVIGQERKYACKTDQLFKGLDADDMMIVGMLLFSGIKQYDTIFEWPRENNIVEELLDEYEAKKDNVKIYKQDKTKSVKYRVTFLDGFNPILDFIDEMDLIPFDKITSTLGDFVYSLPQAHIYGLFKGMCAAKGYLRGNQPNKYIITLETIYDDFSFKIMTMLRRIGIKVYRKHKYGTANSSKPDSIYVHISDPIHMREFMDRVGRFRPLDEWNEFYATISEMIEEGQESPLDDIIPDEILKITELDSSQTYNISVKDNHTFIAGGILVNNSVTMAAEILWRAVTHRNYKIVVVCPFLSQVNMIFDRMRALMSGISPIRRMITRHMLNPPIYTFSNGSTIKGFVAGDSVAGQSANALYMDESDYIGNGEKDRIQPIVFNFPDHIIVEASTPTGRRDDFYRKATEPNAYVEFHYPSHASPNWTDVTDAEYRSTRTEAAYEHEVLAEFGSPESGVFKGDHINNALEMSRLITDIDTKGIEYKRSYTYNEFDQITTDLPDNQKPTFLIGVDWNGADNGTHIVVLAVVDHMLYVANRVSIHAQEFTQSKAVDMIAELNLKYQPKAIYVDEGYGGMQIEVMKMYGKQHKDSKLHKRVHGINFTNKIEIPDPFTGETNKRRLKQFMIDRFQRLVESSRFVLPECENITGGLAEEMRNFEIERYGNSGEPIYSKKMPDHKLFATALAVLAYSQLIEKVDRYPHHPGNYSITKGIIERARASYLTNTHASSRREMDLGTNSLKPSVSRMMPDLKISHGGIVKHDGTVPSGGDRSNRMRVTRGSFGMRSSRRKF